MRQVTGYEKFEEKSSQTSFIDHFIMKFKQINNKQLNKIVFFLLLIYEYMYCTCNRMCLWTKMNQFNMIDCNKCLRLY